uniref:Secreted protein n=1 Tax=Trichogramma kaykai TaxID=54128 RepID=A0ABD2VYH5_9HYME
MVLRQVVSSILVWFVFERLITIITANYWLLVVRLADVNNATPSSRHILVEDVSASRDMHHLAPSERISVPRTLILDEFRTDSAHVCSRDSVGRLLLRDSETFSSARCPLPLFIMRDACARLRQGGGCSPLCSALCLSRSYSYCM